MLRKIHFEVFLIGMLLLSGLHLDADRGPEPGKNFYASDSPGTTVFNLKSPATNRHITTFRDRSKPAPQATADSKSDCSANVVSDYVDKHQVRLEKSTSAMVAINESYDYNYTVIAKDKVKKVVVEEQIPAGATYISSEPEAEVSGSTVTWTLYNLRKRDKVALKLTVKPIQVADLSNCATISADSDKGEPRSVRGRNIDTHLARLEMDSPRRIALNKLFNVDYKVTAKDKIKKVVVESQIPPGATYVSSDPKAEVKGKKVVWALYNLSKGDEVVLKLSANPTEALDLDFYATIDTFPEACTTTQVGVPKLAIVKTTPNEQALIGAGVPWNITVANTGNFCAYDVVVTDTLPAGVSHSSGQGVLTAQLGTLAPGESRDITVNTEAIAIGELCNVAVVRSSNAGSARDDACAVVVGASLDVVSEGTPMQFVGKKASYAVKVTNTGGVPLSDVVVTDTVPSQNKLIDAPGGQISGNVATWTTTLRIGESKSFELTVLGLQKGTYCNQASASSADYGLRDDDDSCTEWRGYPAILTEVIDTEDSLLIGEQTTYVVRITNQGTAHDTKVSLDVALPSQLKVVSAAGDTKGRVSGQDNTVSFSAYPALQAKEIIEFRVVAEAVSLGDARFIAQVESDLLRKPIIEEESTRCYQVPSASSEFGSFGKVDPPALLLEMVDTGDPLLVGEETFYVTQVTNQGEAADTNVSIELEFPSQLRILGANGSTEGNISGGTVVFEPYSTLEAKQIIEFRVKAKAIGEGDLRIKSKLISDSLKKHVVEEEATQVY